MTPPDDLERAIELEIDRLELALLLVGHGIDKGWNLPQVIGHYVAASNLPPEPRSYVVYETIHAWWTLTSTPS